MHLYVWRELPLCPRQITWLFSRYFPCFAMISFSFW